MSSERSLIQHLDPQTVNQLFSQSKMFAEKPQLVMKWHCCISSPLIGQRNYSYDDFDSMRREITKSAGQLIMGNIHIYYGYELPVTTDSSGHNLFTVDQDGNEVPLTEGYHTRVPVNQGEFGAKKETINLEALI